MENTNVHIVKMKYDFGDTHENHKSRARKKIAGEGPQLILEGNTAIFNYSGAKTLDDIARAVALAAYTCGCKEV